MAQERKAVLVSAENIGAHTRLLNLEIQQEPLGFAGGQYIIVHTGAPEIAGKAVKRAYSILSSDREQARIQLAVRRIGPGSDSMHALPVGAVISFSGPWGKYRSDGTPGAALVLATDTGITAAMALAQSAAFDAADFVWMVESDDYFLPESFVRERIGARHRLSILRIPAAGTAERIAWFEDWSRQYRERPGTVFLSGDGLLLYPFRDTLVGSGVNADRIRIETFFNHRKAAVGGSG
jgi:ferredoxin-NADP reductase